MRGLAFEPFNSAQIHEFHFSVLLREATVADRKTLFEPVVQMVSKMTQPPSKNYPEFDMQPHANLWITQLHLMFTHTYYFSHLRQKPPILVAEFVPGQCWTSTKFESFSGLCPSVISQRFEVVNQFLEVSPSFLPGFSSGFLLPRVIMLASETH